MKLPLTAIVMAVEVTYDYNVIVPTGIMVLLVSYLVNLKFSLHKLRFRSFDNLINSI